MHLIRIIFRVYPKEKEIKHQIILFDASQSGNVMGQQISNPRG